MSELVKKFEGIFDSSSPEVELLKHLNSDKLPHHIAVIMDGNGRWAEQRNLPRVAGHRAGIEAVRAVVETAARLSIPVLTLYAFSAENWKRPLSEVRTLMSLLREYIRKELPTIHQNNIRFQTIGRINELPSSVRRELKTAEEETRTNSGTRMIVALNYSGRLELVDAFNHLLENRAHSPISEDDIEKSLYTTGLPEPDLLIRTSGELRVSNFLLWQIAYAEIYVTEVLWPDFRGIHLLEAVVEFQRRERRYGGIRFASLQSTR
ncbi:isoprenyl transferase [Acidobacteria bacterium AH-259-D05]|nr:isoprenyl transferase [Acidobacteria bacterium AH-259-D05]